MEAEDDAHLSRAWLAAKPFVNGGLSGIAATTIIQPVDTVKVRLQLAGGGNPLRVASSIVAKEGLTALYAGLSAAVLRQATYTTSRLGLFQVLSEKLKERNHDRPLPLWEKAAAGLVAGGIGALVGSPADLSLIRMQADGTLPPDRRRNYGNVGNALVSIVKEEGAGGLFTGAGSTAVRAMAVRFSERLSGRGGRGGGAPRRGFASWLGLTDALAGPARKVNMGMLAANDQAKEMLAAKGITGVENAVGAGFVAGLSAAVCSLPFDYVKTQLMKQQPRPDGTLPFAGMLDCFAQTVRVHGPGRLYSGFAAYYMRLAPQSMVTLCTLEWLKVSAHSRACAPRSTVTD